MHEQTHRPAIVTASGGSALVACPCDRVNAVRAGRPYQCECGWAVLLRDDALAPELETALRIEAA